jgi:tetratricopeptide (TPR) repeat protein
LRLALILGKYNEALALLQQNLEESRADKEKEVKACKDLAITLATMGRREEAEMTFGQYLKLSAEYRKSAAEAGLTYFPIQQKSDLFIKGIIQAEIRSFDEAQRTAEALKALIDKGINTKELLYYEYILGLNELGKKNYQKAADFFGKACSRLDHETGYSEPGFWTGSWSEISSDPHAPFLDGLARALYESGDLDKARENYEKIIMLTTGRLDHADIYAKAFYMLGKIAEHQQDKVKAREYYEKFLSFWKDADPGQPEVEDSRKRLVELKGRRIRS